MIRHATRLLVVMLGLAFVGMVAGCGPSGASTGGVTAAASGGADDKAVHLTIGVSIPAADHGWTAGANWWAKQAMKMYRSDNIDFIYSTATQPGQQTKDIRNMMVRGVDALVVLPTESTPLTPVAKQVRQRGIYLVNVDRGFTAPVANLFLQGDNQAFGRKAAQFMVKKLGGQGRIVILRGSPSTVDTARYQAAMKVFNRAKGVRVLDAKFANWNRQEGLSVMQSMLQKHPRIDAVWAGDDDTALGAAQAIREAGRANEMWVVGGGGMNDIVKQVMNHASMFPADVSYPPSMVAAAIHLAISSLRDGRVKKIEKFMPRHLLIDVQLITPENAQDYYFPDSVY